MDWTTEQHKQALEEAKQAAEKWDIDALRKWARSYTVSKYTLIEKTIPKGYSIGAISYSKRLSNEMQKFDNSFYIPVFVKEYQRLGGF